MAIILHADLHFGVDCENEICKEKHVTVLAENKTRKQMMKWV